jgi:hypothetical protein
VTKRKEINMVKVAKCKICERKVKSRSNRPAMETPLLTLQ